MLLLGYSLWPQGYEDYYSYTYKSYNTNNTWQWENAKHDPNGIPDILDEVKYATNYFMRCARNSTTFYSQVGVGNYDHAQWITSVKMSMNSVNTGGSPRGIVKNPNDASMPSFCGATLALMSRLYRLYSASYADSCLVHAKYAYDYAKIHKSTAGADFYNKNKKWQDDFVDLCTELYYATNDEKYKTEALSYAGNVTNHWWVLDYENNDDLAAFNLARLGNTDAQYLLEDFRNSYISDVNSEGVMQVGSSWGPLRYSANAAFVCALYDWLIDPNSKTIHSAIKGTVNYICGINSKKQSFIVGFTKDGTYKSPKYPHHRNVFLNDNNGGTLSIPARNAQHGYLVGGVQSGTFSDDITNYAVSEGGCDYNAGLVGALAYINSKSVTIPTNDANLKSLTASAGTYTPTFAEATINYAMTVKQGSAIPQFTAVAKDAKATVIVMQATSLNGSATMKVTSQDGTASKTYTVKLTEYIPIATTLNITIANNNIKIGTSTQVSGKVLDQNGDEMSSTINWSVSGGGTFSSNTGDSVSLTAGFTTGVFSISASVQGATGVTSTKSITVHDNSADNQADTKVNLALLSSATITGSVSGGRGVPQDILWNPVTNMYVNKADWNEYGVAGGVNLGKLTEANAFKWTVEWTTPKYVNYITIGGSYSNQPQPNTMWKVQYRLDNVWTTIEAGKGGWINAGIYEWGGAAQYPVIADAIRVIAYSDGVNDIVHLHLRARGGVSNSINDAATTPKATLIQYVPVITTAINEATALTPSIRIYPNPASDFISIAGIENIAIVSIYNTQGTLVKLSTSSTNIDITDLSQGMYIVTVTTSDLKSVKTKFVK